MDTVERIKEICKERKIAISRLEKECGFANGYIRNLREGKLPADRLFTIATFLKVTPEYLLTGIETPKESISGKKYYFDDTAAEMAQALYEDPCSRILFDAVAMREPPITVKVISAMLVEKYFMPKKEEVNAAVMVGQAP